MKAIKQLPTRSILSHSKDFLTVDEEKVLCLYVMKGFRDIKKCMKEVFRHTDSTAERQGYKLLKTEKAKKFLSMKADQALEPYNKGADDLIKEIAINAYSDIGNYFERNDNGKVVFKDLLEMGPERRAIKKIKHTRTTTRIDDKTEIIEDKSEYELWSKPEAQKLLAEHHGITKGMSGDVILPIVFMPPNCRDAEVEIQ